MSTVFNTTPVDVLAEPMFFGSGLGIARYDIQRHKVFEELTEKQLLKNTSHFSGDPRKST